MTPEEAVKFTAFLRPEVRAFAIAMEKKLRKNDHKGGWQDCDPQWLLKRAGQELAELTEAVAGNGMVLSEASDVANFALMVTTVTPSPSFPNLKVHKEMEQIDGA